MEGGAGFGNLAIPRIISPEVIVDFLNGDQDQRWSWAGRAMRTTVHRGPAYGDER